MSSNIKTKTVINYKQDLTVDIHINYSGEPIGGLPSVLLVDVTKEIIYNINEGHLYAIVVNTNTHLQLQEGNLIISVPTTDANQYSIESDKGYLKYDKQ